MFSVELTYSTNVNEQILRTRIYTLCLARYYFVLMFRVASVICQINTTMFYRVHTMFFFFLNYTLLVIENDIFVDRDILE